jgi:D-glycero-D-manno-heptose 1,7-bisphosphate phosphatase
MKFTKLNLVTRFCRFFLPSDHRVIKKGVSARESKRAVFIDLDGTLWPDMGPGSILKNPVIDMGVILRLNQLSNAGYLLIGITNQTYFGYRSELNPVSIFRYRYKLRRIVRDRVLDMIYICHHHPDSNIFYLRAECPRRKPSNGLIQWAKTDLSLELDKSIVIGDRITDMIAGQKSRIASKFLIVNPRFLEWNISEHKASISSVTFSVSRNLVDVLDSIKSEIL